VDKQANSIMYQLITNFSTTVLIQKTPQQTL